MSKASHWEKSKPDNAVKTTVTRSWDDSMDCVNCMKGKCFMLVISDQHQPCEILAFEGICVATIRMQDMTLAQLIDHTIHIITEAAL